MNSLRTSPVLICSTAWRSFSRSFSVTLCLIKGQWRMHLSVMIQPKARLWVLWLTLVALKMWLVGATRKLIRMLVFSSCFRCMIKVQGSRIKVQCSQAMIKVLSTCESMIKALHTSLSASSMIKGSTCESLCRINDQGSRIKDQGCSSGFWGKIITSQKSPKRLENVRFRRLFVLSSLLTNLFLAKLANKGHLSLEKRRDKSTAVVKTKKKICPLPFSNRSERRPERWGAPEWTTTGARLRAHARWWPQPASFGLIWPRCWSHGAPRHEMICGSTCMSYGMIAEICKNCNFRGYIQHETIKTLKQLLKSGPGGGKLWLDSKHSLDIYIYKFEFCRQ